jgi:hypothetical protein
MLIASLLAAILSGAQARQFGDTLRVWDAILRASYDSTARGSIRQHPPRGLLPWLKPVVSRTDTVIAESVSLDSAWLRDLIRDGLIRGVCSADCADKRDPLRIELGIPHFLTPSEATVLVTYITVVTDAGSPGCGYFDMDQLKFRVVRGDVVWRAVERSFIGGGSGVMFSPAWDAVCLRTPRPEAAVARMAGVWGIRLRGSPSGRSGDSVDVIGQMTVPDSAVRERAPANVFQAQGAYDLNPVPLFAQRGPSCGSLHGRIGIYTIEGDTDSLYMELSPTSAGGFECLLTFKVVADADSLRGMWCSFADPGCPSRGTVTIRRRNAP